MSCPALVKLRSPGDGPKLVITEISEEHNHEVNRVCKYTLIAAVDSDEMFCFI